MNPKTPSKPKCPPRSLFKAKRTVLAPARDLKAQVAAWRAMATRTTGQQLDEMIATIAAAAERAKADGAVEQGAEYAKQIEIQILMVRSAIERQDASCAAMEALRLSYRWMQLRTDALFAKPIRAFEAQRAPKVTDQQIEHVLRRTNSQAEASELLGITPRQIRDRIPKSKRDEIKAARK